jgi:hypothetical protein
LPALDAQAAEGPISRARQERPALLGELELQEPALALWLAKRHGHSVFTMLNMYAAWTKGAKESDIEAIKRESSLRSSSRIVASPTILDAPSGPMIWHRLGTRRWSRKVRRPIPQGCA